MKCHAIIVSVLVRSLMLKSGFDIKWPNMEIVQTKENFDNLYIIMFKLKYILIYKKPNNLCISD